MYLYISVAHAGFNVETVKYKGINFTTWDVSGRDKIVSREYLGIFVFAKVPTVSCIPIITLSASQRPLWRHYYQNTDVLIFVVDSNDRERMAECKDELSRFMMEDELKDCIVLVMANKQDLPNAMTVQEITEKLELNKMPADREWCKSGIVN